MIRICLIFTSIFFVNNIYSSCFKDIKVLIYEKSFSLNLFNPKISNREYVEIISIDCLLYNKIKKNDILRDEELSKYMKYNKIIPHGMMIKKRYKVLAK
jgi:hypothetical protein